MPTYQYACTSCGEDLEVVQKFSDGPLTECPVCGGRLRKVFSPVGVVFKGSGFYKTDSRRTGKKKKADENGAKREGTSTADSSGGSSGSSSGSSSSSSGKDASTTSDSTSGGSTGGSESGSGASPTPSSSSSGQVA
jgi:putative FmdB family regulatory protein